MKKTLVLAGLSCIAGISFASDVVLNIQLNGLEIEDGHKTEKVMENAILVIEDFGSETNTHAGMFYSLGNKKGKGRSVSYYSAEEVLVKVLFSSNHKQFGMLVEFESAYLAGTGQATANKEGDYSQITISAGHGAFLYAGFSEPSSSTNTVMSESIEDDTLEELEVGKMQASLNKKLTEKAKESDGVTAVEAWLDENNIIEHSK